MTAPKDPNAGTHFFQEGPQTPDLYACDAALQSELARRLSDGAMKKMAPRYEAMGKETATTLVALANRAEAEPPRHIPYNPWGRRVDEIAVSDAWKALQDFSATHGIVAAGYDTELGEERRCAQAALLYLFSSSSATYSCPLAMTDAAARVLLDVAPDDVRDRLVPRLTSTDPKTFITSGQWMTERTGGSDVGGTATFARPTPNGSREFGLHGTKWFTSATTSEMALTLARLDDGENDVVAGSRGLTLFQVDVERDAHGALNGILVNRLKDKLGTKALPTAELTLNGAPATRLSAPGRGVATIATMLNVTRLYNAVASVSSMARGLALVRDYAERRVAFGKKLSEQPLHQRTIAGLEAQTAGALSFTLEAATLLGKLEAGTATDEENARLRGLIPLAKLTLGKAAVAAASESLECFGGAGYIEDTQLPRLLRDAQVLAIWEGTTNVLSLDVLRAEHKSKALSAVVQNLFERAEALPASLPSPALDAVRASLARLRSTLATLSNAEPDVLETYARDVALTCGRLVSAVNLGETVAFAHASDAKVEDRFVDYCRLHLSAPLAFPPTH